MQLRTVTGSYCTPFAAIGFDGQERKKKKHGRWKGGEFQLITYLSFNALLWSYIVVSDQLNP